jgi:hypothetical protein
LEPKKETINVPPFLERTLVKPATGFNDWPFFTVKQRLVSANEENGNYIVSAFLGVQAPTGIAAFTNHSWIVTPRDGAISIQVTNTTSAHRS